MPEWEPLKINAVFDYIYGINLEKLWEVSALNYEISRAGRIRRIKLEGMLYATVRSDGSLAFTIEGAKPLVLNEDFRREYAVVVDDASEAEIKRGNSVFAGHIIRAGSGIKPKMDVPVLNREGKIIAVGRATIPGRYMMAFKKGMAVKIRDYVKMPLKDYK